MGPKSYGLVVTDERSIFVLQSTSKAVLGGAIGGAVGAAIGQALSKDRGVNIEQAALGELAGDPRNLVVPHTAIRRLRVRKSWGTYRLIIHYVQPDGKRSKISGELTVSFQGAKQLGISVREFAERRGSEVRAAYKRALTPDLQLRFEIGG